MLHVTHRLRNLLTPLDVFIDDHFYESWQALDEEPKSIHVKLQNSFQIMQNLTEVYAKLPDNEKTTISAKCDVLNRIIERRNRAAKSLYREKPQQSELSMQAVLRKIMSAPELPCNQKQKCISKCTKRNHFEIALRQMCYNMLNRRKFRKILRRNDALAVQIQQKRSPYAIARYLQKVIQFHSSRAKNERGQKNVRNRRSAKKTRPK